MLSPTVILTALAAFANSVAAAGVTGAAEGFAKGVTGGGSATPVYPSTNAELVSYLTDSSARVIILTKTFDFTNTEGTTTEAGCAPYGTASGCQLAINKDDVSGHFLRLLSPAQQITNACLDSSGARTTRPAPLLSAPSPMTRLPGTRSRSSPTSPWSARAPPVSSRARACTWPTVSRTSSSRTFTLPRSTPSMCGAVMLSPSLVPT